MRELVPRRRARVLLGVLLVSLLGLGVRLGYVQGVRSDEYQDLARQQRYREIDLPPHRGAIYDRNGRELAISVPARTIYANPKHIADPAATARALAEVLGRDALEIEEDLRKDKGFVYVARRVDVETAQRVADLELVGVDMLDEAERVYPAGTLAANVLGFVGTDATGLAGLEFAYEDLLGGRPGRRIVEQDPLGRRIPQGVFSEEPPVGGSDLVLTIDRDIQHAAERALGRAVEDYHAAGGTVVVVDPRTGEILAMANSPTFDPNEPKISSLDDARNRAVTDVYEPGSVNKVVTAAAALETGTVTPETPFSIPASIAVGGTRFSDSHGHATYTRTFSEVIVESSNVGTIKAALMVGADPLHDYLQRFGYGEGTGLGFPGEVSGILPRTDRWSTSLPTMAIGQGLSVTMLQLTRVYSTVANGGVMAEPTLVKGWIDPAGRVHDAPSARSHRVIAGDVASTLQTILTKVVAEGTGTRAQVAGYSVAGKTGTAQKPSPTGGYAGYMASFVGFLPADDPQLVIGVTLDEPSPYWGGVVAAPVFQEVATSAVRILRIPPAAIEAIGAGEAPTDDGPALATAPRSDGAT